MRSADGQSRAGPEYFDARVPGFQGAIAGARVFALAYYRLGVSGGWGVRWTIVGRAVGRAHPFPARLGGRDRRLLQAYDAYRGGAAEAAERQYRAILQDYPDDLEAEFQLANVLYHYNAPRGRPRAEARELFDRVLSVDPEFLCPI